MQIQAIQSISSPMGFLAEDSFVQRANRIEGSQAYEPFESSQPSPASSDRRNPAFSNLLRKLDIPELEIENKRVKVQLSHSQRPIVSVIDTRTNEVIQEVPPEELLDILDNLQSNLGKLLDQDA